MFAYCRNNPVNRADATGTLDFDCDTEVDTDDLTGGKLNDFTGGGQQASTPTATQSSSVTIYRYGFEGTGASKLVPTDRDVNSSKPTGLSFSTKYRSGAAMTTIDAVNSTGVLYAIQDGISHVSIYPIGGTISDWFNAGVASIWTQELLKIIGIS